MSTRIGDVVVDVADPADGADRAAGAVVRATIDRPRARNALSPSVLDGLAAACDVARDAQASVFVVGGTGGTLSAGADLHHVHGLVGDRDGIDSYLTAIGATLDRLADLPCVTVAVVGGHAVAGGCELLLACDLAVAATDAGIGDRHLEYGLLPGAGGSVRLPRALPGALARRLLYTGEIVDGATAHAWGLVSHVAPPGELDATVEALVARLARHSPAALHAMKRLHRDAAPPADAATLAAERAVAVAHLSGSPAVREGLEAFRTGRPPDFSPGGPVAVGPRIEDEST
ncbi:enoyl-CoA hydratase [Actinomycetospora sp. NBRC 106375]|uniref:enoyl-CoA hydratase/isomerase family protein n=1 Tax=Actinomycetospora sp. NBRC 106375 TaxID=3032207 RepID=UPI0024A58976|nr:enoyl-CoA hydratase/isomerase family protein [Actinomycetospora sp. NBRC 106375]GLZ46988.1 enoyl-CoA hydratase [Actinomycetospora sp. NBRC 106375]